MPGAPGPDGQADPELGRPVCAKLHPLTDNCICLKTRSGVIIEVGDSAAARALAYELMALSVEIGESDA